MDRSRPVNDGSTPAHSPDEKPVGVPEFILEMAQVLRQDGKSASSALAIAVSRVRQLAAQGDPKAAKAAAAWDRLKARSPGSVSRKTNLETLLKLAQKD